MKEKIHVITNTGLLAEAMIGFVLMSGFAIYLVLNRDDPNAYNCMIVFIPACFLSWSLILVTCHRWLGFITLDSYGITYRAFMKKTEFRPYSFYTHVDYACYFDHRIMRGHVVFSNCYLDKNLQIQINRARSDIEFIKIRMNQKKYDKLMSILPPSHQVKLRAALQAQEDLFIRPVYHNKRRKKRGKR